MSVESKGRCAAQNRAVQAMGGTLVPVGTRVAQDRNGGIYVPFVQPFARQAGIEQGTEVGCLLHVETGALIVTPPGVDPDVFQQ